MPTEVSWRSCQRSWQKLVASGAELPPALLTAVGFALRDIEGEAGTHASSPTTAADPRLRTNVDHSLEVGALSADGSRVWTGRFWAVNSAQAARSDDGQFYWDGQKWVSTMSPDGHYRWTGSAWLPLAGIVRGPAYPHYQQPAMVRMATPWMKPMQFAVVTWYLITGLYALSLPFWMSSVAFQAIFQAESPPYSNASHAPPDVVGPATAIISGFLWISAIVAVAIAAVVILGALKRWTWMFYVVLVLFGLTSLSLPGSITNAALGPTPQNLLPSWIQWIYVAFGIGAAAIFVWMLVAVFRYGPWATIKTTTSWPQQQEPVTAPNLLTPF